jgi:hypothetical protein
MSGFCRITFVKKKDGKITFTGWSGGVARHAPAVLLDGMYSPHGQGSEPVGARRAEATQPKASDFEIAMKKATIATQSDWRGKAMARIRKLIKQADPQAVEAVKWITPSNPAGALVWYHDG